MPKMINSFICAFFIIACSIPTLAGELWSDEEFSKYRLDNQEVSADKQITNNVTLHLGNSTIQYVERGRKAFDSKIIFSQEFPKWIITYLYTKEQLRDSIFTPAGARVVDKISGRVLAEAKISDLKAREWLLYEVDYNREGVAIFHAKHYVTMQHNLRDMEARGEREAKYFLKWPSPNFFD